MLVALRSVSAVLRRAQVEAIRQCSTVESLAPPKRQSPFNLFDLLARLPNYGVGSCVYRSSWAAKGYSPETHHWRITRSKDFKIVQLLLIQTQRFLWCSLFAHGILIICIR